MNRNSKSIYMEPIARKYANKYLRYDPDIVFLHVNHDLNDIIAFHNMISGYFSESVFLTIPYTIGKLEYQRKVGILENQYKIYRDDTGYYICRDGKIVCDTGSSLQVQMRDMFAVALDVIYKDLKGKKLLILEDGGYCAVFVIIGMLFFSMGAEMSMSPMGERVGGSMLKTKKLWVILLLGFFLGVIITISEPDLQVLAAQVPSVPNMVLILSVAAGVGAFLVVALLRILFGIALAPLLVVFYGVIFVIARFVPDNFLAVAFDSGGVTTGPMTVPFIMALGVGISAIRNDKHAENDSFGLVALCSIGPVLAVLLLGLVYPAQGSYVAADVPEAFNSVELGRLFLSEIPYYLKEIAGSLLPIVFFFGIFQLVSIQLHKKTLIKICVGLLYTYVGLVLFLTGDVGFIPAGNYLGTVMASLPCPWILVPVGMVIGYFIVKAEPAVYVLMKQVEELTDGDISGKAMQISLSVGVAASVGLSMLRVLTGIPIMYFLIPGYAIALFLTLFVPKIFTAIAFDSGGVASGPMTATFLLPLAQGACTAVGGDVVKDAFGVVAMVAMTPLITLQVLGLIYKIKSNKKEEMAEQPFLQAEDVFAGYADDAIIEL